jgi:hypothetical protein
MVRVTNRNLTPGSEVTTLRGGHVSCDCTKKACRAPVGAEYEVGLLHAYKSNPTPPVAPGFNTLEA